MTTTQPLETESGATDAHGPGPENTRGTPGGSGPHGDERQSRGRRLPRIGPILPERLRPTGKLPPMWLEFLFIAGSYSLYTLTRLAAPAHAAAAQNRGREILDLEHYLGLNFEHSVNHWVFHMRWLAFGMNVYYATLHFIVPVAVLIWVYLRHPDRYRAIRTVMFAMTGLALIGFYFYSLAPPRLLHNGDFIDTFKLLNPWGQTASTSDGVAGLSATNEYAAMPSLHIGWSTWCALAIAHLARRKWVKALGIAYPFATFAVIIGTANHYVLDAVGGLIVLGAGFLVERLLLGRPVYAPGPGELTDADIGADTSRGTGTGTAAGKPGGEGRSLKTGRSGKSGKNPGLPQQPAFPSGEDAKVST